MTPTKVQKQDRDADIDWHLAQLFYHAKHQTVWADFSPTTDWAEGGKIIERYNVDIRWFDPEYNPTLEAPWMGGLMCKNTNGITVFITAFGHTPLHAAMKAVAKAYPITSS